MKYAVIYQTKSGNTEIVAESIFNAIDSDDKVMFDLEDMSYIPKADVYFIGFGVQNNNCSLEMIEVMEELGHSKCALFSTCGLFPTESYKEKLINLMKIWLPEECEFLGMYLCQGESMDAWKKQMFEKHPGQKETLEEMFEKGKGHPNSQDLSEAAHFVKEIQDMAEYY